MTRPLARRLDLAGADVVADGADVVGREAVASAVGGLSGAGSAAGTVGVAERGEGEGEGVGVGVGVGPDAAAGADQDPGSSGGPSVPDCRRLCAAEAAALALLAGSGVWAMAAAATAVTENAITATFRCFIGHLLGELARLPPDSAGGRGKMCGKRHARALGGRCGRRWGSRHGGLSCAPRAVLEPASRGVNLPRMNYAQAVTGIPSSSERMSHVVRDEGRRPQWPDMQRTDPPMRESNLALLRDWSHDFSAPGAWSADAWRAVGAAILVMPEWPGPMLEIEVQGHRHVYVPAGPCADRLHLVQGPSERDWSAQPMGAGLAPPHRQGGDAFFEALVDGLADTSMPPERLSPAQDWRRRVARLLLDGVTRGGDVQRSGHWLQELLTQLPQPIEQGRAAGPAVASWADKVRQAHPPAMSMPPRRTPTAKAASRSATGAQADRGAEVSPDDTMTLADRQLLSMADTGAWRYPALSQGVTGHSGPFDNHWNFLDEPPVRRVVRQAFRALARGDVGGACAAVETIQPSHKVPIFMVAKICSEASGADEVPRAADMLERLAKGVAPMFDVGLGYDGTFDTLDFRYVHLFTAEVVPRSYHPDGLSEPSTPAQRQRLLAQLYGQAAATSAVAEVLFHLHWTRGRLKVGTHLVVGEHGSGSLKRTMERCIEDCGWTWQPALVMGKKNALRGEIVIAPATGELTPQQRWARRSEGSLDDYEDQLRNAANGRDLSPTEICTLQSLQWRTYARLGVHGVLEVLQRQPLAPQACYHWLWQDVTRLQRLDDADKVLGALIARHRPLSEASWCALLSASRRGGLTAWRCCELVRERMRQERVRPNERVLNAMLSVATESEHLAVLDEPLNQAFASGRLRDSTLAQSWLKAASTAGDGRRWEAALGRLGGRLGAAFQSLQAQEVLLLTRQRRFARAMSQHEALRKLNVPFERKMLSWTMKWLWKAKHWRMAAEILRASLHSGDDYYDAALGWRLLDGVSTCRVDRYALLKPTPADVPRKGLGFFEGLTVLALHRLDGRLDVGSVIDLSGTNAALNEESVRGELALMGIVLAPCDPDSQAMLGYWKVVELWPMATRPGTRQEPRSDALNASA